MIYLWILAFKWQEKEEENIIEELGTGGEVWGGPDYHGGGARKKYREELKHFQEI